MRLKYWKTGILLISVLLLVFITPDSFAGNYDRTFSSQVQFGLVSHELYVSVPSSLYDYYSGKTRSISDDSQYASFVTPDAFQSIADNIRNLTRDKPRSDEEFANTVLQLVHQVQYAIDDVKYPVETLVENSGKCDTLSLLAASIMKAGGLDVVLLYHKEVHHINVGVYLPYEPHGTWWWLTPTGYEHNGKKYWIAECTPATEWKVGDVPPLLADTKPSIISLENSEQSSPAHVSSSLDSPLIPSSISITLSSENSSAAENVRTFTISGLIAPKDSGKSILMYVNHDGTSCDTFRTVTDDLGNYSLTWNCTSTGTYYIKTSLSGSANYAGSDSETLTVFIGYHPVVGVELSDYEDTGPGDFFNRANTALSYKIFASKGSEEILKNNLTGANVQLSGEFIMLNNGQAPTVQRIKKIITVPTSEVQITMPGRRTMMIPRMITTVSESEQTINNQVGFILRHDGGSNHTASVKVLDEGTSQTTEQLDGDNSAFMNASMDTIENTWYKVVVRINEDKRTTELYDANGTLIKNAETRNDTLNNGEFGVLMDYDINTVLAFKNLKAETLNQPTQPVSENEVSVSELEVPVQYIGLTILLAVAVAAIAYAKERKRGKND